MIPAGLSPQTIQRLQAGAAALQQGRPAEAKALLQQVLLDAPRLPDALHLYGVALFKLGDAVAAEPPLRQAIAADKRQASFHVGLGDALAALGRPVEAEKSYRAALVLDRRFAPAVRQLTLLLANLGRGAAALQVIAPLAASGLAAHGLLTANAAALKAAGRSAEAVEVYRKAVAAAPASGVAEHNLAATLGDLGRHQEAEAAARRALAKGGDAPETWLVLGRSLLRLARGEEAEDAFRAALSRRPGDLAAHRDLAQAIWMRTGAVAEATAALDADLFRSPDALGLRRLKAKVLEFAGDSAGADEVLSEAVARNPDDANLLLSAAHAAIEAGDPVRGLGFAERATAMAAADDPQAALGLCEALLANGRGAEVAAIAEPLSRRSDHGQQALAYLATAWRLMGDERYRALYDYDAFVRPAPMETPSGWSSLPDYLAELAIALNGEHRHKTHPLDQSLRRGSQIDHVLQMDHPALRAFPQAIDGPIRAYMAALGKGKDPLRARNSGDYRLHGAWSVKLRPGGGRHVDHMHPEGWLSSACYIELPGSVEEEGRQGWLKFGEPGVPTTPRLGPEHFVKPETGLLVLFPSYMWHGTVPFEGTESRLTIAFDLVPDRLRRDRA